MSLTTNSTSPPNPESLRITTIQIISGSLTVIEFLVIIAYILITLKMMLSTLNSRKPYFFWFLSLLLCDFFGLLLHWTTMLGSVLQNPLRFLSFDCYWFGYVYLALVLSHTFHCLGMTICRTVRVTSPLTYDEFFTTSPALAFTASAYVVGMFLTILFAGLGQFQVAVWFNVQKMSWVGGRKSGNIMMTAMLFVLAAAVATWTMQIKLRQMIRRTNQSSTAHIGMWTTARKASELRLMQLSAIIPLPVCVYIVLRYIGETVLTDSLPFRVLLVLTELLLWALNPFIIILFLNSVQRIMRSARSSRCEISTCHLKASDSVQALRQKRSTRKTKSNKYEKYSLVIFDGPDVPGEKVVSLLHSDRAETVH